MLNRSVAVLDIRSSEVCAVFGERGVNNTFIIKSKYSCPFDGFADGELLDINSFNYAVESVVKSTLAATSVKVRTFHVSVPSEFIKVVTKDEVLSFPSPKRITCSHLKTLSEMAMPNLGADYTVIKNSPLYYVLADKRKLINPVGAVSDSLRGALSYYFCKTSFIECVVNVFKKFERIDNVNLIPQNYAEAMYLVEPEKRDSYSVLFDLGYISSSYSVICGNGICFSEWFSVGIGHIAVLLMERLDIPFDVANIFLGKVNLNAKERLATIEECRYEGKNYSFATSVLRDIIREGLDGICETLEECRQSFTGKNLSDKPLLVTGEGIKAIRGAAEHISSRLEIGVEVIAPKVPYFDKPKFSSLFSLLNAALGE